MFSLTPSPRRASLARKGNAHFCIAEGGIKESTSLPSYFHEAEGCAADGGLIGWMDGWGWGGGGGGGWDGMEGAGEKCRREELVQY